MPALAKSALAKIARETGWQYRPHASHPRPYEGPEEFRDGTLCLRVLGAWHLKGPLNTYVVSLTDSDPASIPHTLWITAIGHIPHVTSATTWLPVPQTILQPKRFEPPARIFHEWLIDYWLTWSQSPIVNNPAHPDFSA